MPFRSIANLLLRRPADAVGSIAYNTIPYVRITLVLTSSGFSSCRMFRLCAGAMNCRDGSAHDVCMCVQA